MTAVKLPRSCRKGNNMPENKNSKQSYESCLARLQEIIQKLEIGNTSLDESISLYEEGIKCAEMMQKQLSAASGKITKLEKRLDAFQESPFDESGEEQ